MCVCVVCVFLNCTQYVICVVLCFVELLCCAMCCVVLCYVLCCVAEKKVFSTSGDIIAASGSKSLAPKDTFRILVCTYPGSTTMFVYI